MEPESLRQGEPEYSGQETIIFRTWGTRILRLSGTRILKTGGTIIFTTMGTILIRTGGTRILRTGPETEYLGQVEQTNSSVNSIFCVLNF